MRGHPLGIRFVDTVPSAYCSDLVSPMVQLLRAATEESTSGGDKFVFLSESTLPVKPFSDVYSTLTKDSKSDFCISTNDHWGHLASSGDESEKPVLVKHSQWVVLSREHANLVVERWPKVKGAEVGNYWALPVWSVTRQATKRWKIAEANGASGVRCTDEWAFFAMVYGVVPVKSGQSRAKFTGLNAGPLVLSGAAAETKDQGVCRTFATWGLTSAQNAQATATALADTSGTELSCFPQCLSLSPGEFTRISDQGLEVLRHSDFLFARKFEKQSVTLDQFKRMILAPPPPQAPSGMRLADSSPFTDSSRRLR